MTSMKLLTARVCVYLLLTPAVSYAEDRYAKYGIVAPPGHSLVFGLYASLYNSRYSAGQFLEFAAIGSPGAGWKDLPVAAGRHSARHRKNLQRGFLTGTTATMQFTEQGFSSNNVRSEINPVNTRGLSLNVTQHLLQGFGWR